MDLTETAWEGLEWIQLAQNAIHWRGPVNIQLAMKLWGSMKPEISRLV
jgi:hypothetical protein